MRLHLAVGDATAAWQVYSALRSRLAQKLRIKPSPETVALADRIRANATSRRGEPAVSPAASQPPGELVAPLIGRASAFSQLVARYQQLRQGQAQGVLVVGEAGVGKTRLAHEFVSWARAHGADVLIGHAFEMRGHLPYQPLIEALREGLEGENAPEDLLEDLWLAELSRLLPELRVRYRDLTSPAGDELMARMRQVVLIELGEARRQVLSQRAAGRIESEAIKFPNEQPTLSRPERAGLSLAPARRAPMPTRSTQQKSEGLLWPLSFQGDSYASAAN